MEIIEAKIKQIEARNQRVEADKAWETSRARKLLIASFTYLVIGLFMASIEVAKPWINAIVPTLGFILSTLSMPYFKKLWLARFLPNNETATNNESIINEVRGLSLPLGQYALFGSAPLGARGLKVCADADLIVTKELWDEYRDKPDWELKKAACGTDGLVKGDVELYNIWKPGEWEADQLIAEAEMIDGLPFVKLEYVLEWKKLRNLEKDQGDIKLIENFLKS